MEIQRRAQGFYTESKVINGKSSWKSATLALWYFPEKKRWIFGNHQDIGSDRGWIRSSANKTDVCPQHVKKDKWDFWGGNNWQRASTNDVRFLCTGKK